MIRYHTGKKWAYADLEDDKSLRDFIKHKKAGISEIGFSTALADKNGATIYEGDFLHDPGNYMSETLGGSALNFLVGFERGAFMLGRRLSCPKSKDTYLWLVADKLEIVGNRIDTPRLLTTSGWHYKRSQLDTRPTVVLDNGHTCEVNEDGVRCFCDLMLIPHGGRVTVGDKCKCGAKVVDI